MGLRRLLKPRRANVAGQKLYDSAVTQARRPGLYTDPAAGGLGAPDTVEGRFELYTLHVVLLLHRLKRQGQEAADVGQALFDAYIHGLDDALRELGVGDLSVGKKMRKLGEAFYGRAKSYDEALEALPDTGPLQAVIARTVLAGTDGGQSQALTTYAAHVADRLGAVAVETLCKGGAEWPEAGA